MDTGIGIGDVAALVGAVSAGLYIIGLIGLSIPIRIRYTQTLSAAWHAVTLVPKSIVVTQGLRIWLTWPLLIAVLLTLESLWLRPIFGSIAVSVIKLLTYLAVIYYLFFRKSSGGSAADAFGRLSWSLIILLYPINGVTGFLGGALLFAASQVSVEGIQFVYLIEFLIGTFFIALSVAQTLDAPLPTAELALEGVSDPVRGRVVAHSDRLLHYFVEGEYGLRSIPNERVLEVRTIR